MVYVHDKPLVIPRETLNPKDIESDIEMFRQIRCRRDICSQIAQLGIYPDLRYAVDQLTKRGLPAEKVQEYKEQLEATKPIYDSIAAESKRELLLAYWAGLGRRSRDCLDGNNPISKFSRKRLLIHVGVSDEMAAPIIESLDDFMAQYEIPLTYEIIRDSTSIRDVHSLCNKDGLFNQLGTVGTWKDELSIYITNVRGMVPKDCVDLRSKNPEEFYGCGDINSIVFTLGGEKDVSAKRLREAAVHEFIHMCGEVRHHDELIRQNSSNQRYFHPEERCVFSSNDLALTRGEDPCSYLDYEIRLRVAGFHDNLSGL